MPGVNGELRDRAIRHAIELGRYSRGTSDRMVRLLNTADQELQDRIAAGVAGMDERGVLLSRSTQKRLAALQAELRAVNAAIYGQLGEQLADELGQLASAEADFQKDSLDAALGTDLLTALPAPRLLASIADSTPIQGKLLSGWVDGMAAGRIERVGAAIQMGMVQGESTDQIVRRIRGTKAAGYRDGVLDISRRSAQTIVRTSVTAISNTAAQATWKANADLIQSWQFLATLDTRTTITCASLDGSTYPVGEGPVPPLHLACRSISVAVTRSFRDLGVDADEIPEGKRASMDGQVAGGTTFQTWLKSKDSAIQEKILGKTRADLFRSGKLDLAQFTKNDGQVLTLKQLRAAHQDILAK